MTTPAEQEFTSGTSTVAVGMTQDAFDNVEEVSNRLGGQRGKTFALADGRGLEAVYAFPSNRVANDFKRRVRGIAGVRHVGLVNVEGIGVSHL